MVLEGEGVAEGGIRSSRRGSWKIGGLDVDDMGRGKLKEVVQGKLR